MDLVNYYRRAVLVITGGRDIDSCLFNVVFLKLTIKSLPRKLAPDMVREGGEGEAVAIEKVHTGMLGTPGHLT